MSSRSASSWGITINDLVLSTAAGALRELLLRHDGRADRPIVASVPASLNNSPGPNLIASWTAYLPPPIAPAMFRWISRRKAQTKLLNLRISNVRGPRARGRLGGTMLREFYSVGPLVAGSGMNITVWSYVDQLNIAVLTDDLTLRDPHEATDAMIHAFGEIRRAAGCSDQLTVVDTAMAQASAIA